MSGYKGVDPGVFNKNTEAARTRKFGGGDYWKPEVGKSGSPVKNVIRILPPHENMPDVFVETKVHFSLGPKEDISIRCLTPWGEICPACDYVNNMFRDARAESDPEAQKMLKKKAGNKAAKLRFYANIVDMQRPESGVQVYPFGPEIEKLLRNRFYDDDNNFRDITHPKTGRDVILNVDKKPNTDFNQYDIKTKESSSALKDMAWVDGIRDLAEYTKKPSEAEITAALGGQKPSSTPAATQPKTETKAEPPKGEAPKGTAAKPKTTVKRQAVIDEAAAPVDPYVSARAYISATWPGGTPIEPPDDPAAVAKEKNIPCFGPFLVAANQETVTDPTDKMCQGCRLLIPCAASGLKK